MHPSTSQNSTGEPSWFLIRLVIPTGTTKNSTIASTSATTIVPSQTARGISSPSPALLWVPPSGPEPLTAGAAPLAEGGAVERR